MSVNPTSALCAKRLWRRRSSKGLALKFKIQAVDLHCLGPGQQEVIFLALRFRGNAYFLVVRIVVITTQDRPCGTVVEQHEGEQRREEHSFTTIVHVRT